MTTREFDDAPVLFDLHTEDCLLVLASLPDSSVDAIVTDPPYGLADLPAAKVAKVMAEWAAGNWEAAPTGRGFMGKSWDAFVPPPAVWAECLRVLKPGGHVVAFAGSRTVDLMGLSIRLAGFEIRDTLNWVTGQGFPKSLNVGKALEALARTGSSSPKGQREAAMGEGYEPSPLAGTPGYGVTGNFANPDTGNPGLELTDAAARQWAGWGTSLKPSHEPIVLARKPLDGTVAGNVLAHGVGGLNIDGCRVGRAGCGDVSRAGHRTATFGSQETTPGGDGSGGWVQDSAGRWPTNTLLTHAAACRRVGVAVEQVEKNVAFSEERQSDGWGVGRATTSPVGVEREVWQCVLGCPVVELDTQSGVLSAGHWAKSKVTGFGEFGGGTSVYEGPGRKATDVGGASRFFPQTAWEPAVDDVASFLYAAKPSKREKNAGLDGLPRRGKVFNGKSSAAGGCAPGSVEAKFSTAPQANTHVTVKPVSVMAWLIRLVCPPGGVVLDPFMGSGTTGVAAVQEGCRFVGVERDGEYAAIAAARIAHVAGGER